MQMQLWLSLTPSGQGLVLLERLEGEESISHPSARALGKEKGMEQETLFFFFFLELPTPLRRAGFWGPLSLQQVQCVQRRMWPPRHFSIPGSYDLQSFLGLHWNGSSAKGFRTTDSAFHSTSLPRASGWEELAGIMATWIQFQSTQ